MNKIDISREVFWSVFLALLFSICIFALNYGVKGPTIQADEGSYLANAAAIAGFHNDLASNYFSGYSFFIAPAFWIADNPYDIWIIVKAVNATLYFVTVFGLWWIAKYLNHEMDLRERAVVVILVSLYPMWVVMAGYSFAQIAFVPVFLLVFYMLLRSTEGGLWAWVGLGLAVGYLYWIHPVAVSPLIAACVASAYIAWKRRCYSYFFTLLLTMAVMVLAYKYAITPWLNDRMTISELSPSLRYPRISQMLSTLLSFEGLKEVLSRLGGHLFYLTIGTMGLIWVGIFSLFSKMFSAPAERNNNQNLLPYTITIFLILSLAGIIALSVLLFSFSSDAQRLDHWMYGRYVEGVIAPILLIGILSRSFRKAFWALPIAVLCAFLLSIGLDHYIHTAPFNVSAFWQEFFLRDKGLWLWLASGCALIALVAGTSRRIGMFVIAGVFACSSYLQIIWHEAGAKGAVNRWSAALAVRNQFAPGTCVGFDHAGIDSYKKHLFWFDFGFVLFDYQMKRMSFEHWLDSCDGPLFTYAKDLDAKRTEVFMILVSPHGGPVAWMKGRPPAEKLYPMRVEDRTASLLKTIGTGWHDFERAHVWSGPNAKLNLPVPGDCVQETCHVVLTFRVYGASQNRPVNITFQTNKAGVPLLSKLVVNNSDKKKVTIPLAVGHPIQTLSIDVPEAVSPKDLQGSADSRVLGIALLSIELARFGAGVNEQTPRDDGAVQIQSVINEREQKNNK